MIKIQLTDHDKKELNSMHWNDADKNKTGLNKILEESTIKNLLKTKHKKIYNLLYDSSGIPIETEVKQLLQADKTKMEEYITKLGRYDPKNKTHVKESKELIKEVFKYDNFSSRNIAYDIMKKINVKVCPYCNRQYTFTLRNCKKSKVRPQFDHYFPKSEYPYLALTLFNLVPSCSICNLAKSSLDTYAAPILYPYEDEFGEDIMFKTKLYPGASILKYVQGLTDEFNVIIENPKHIMTDKVKKQIETMHLEELYNEHKDYIQDIAKNCYINTDKRVKELCAMYPLLFNTEMDVINTFLMNDIKKENWGKRPLSKLTKDIYDDLS